MKIAVLLGSRLEQPQKGLPLVIEQLVAIPIPIPSYEGQDLHEPPVANPHDGCCGMGRRNTCLDPIMCHIGKDLVELGFHQFFFVPFPDILLPNRTQ
ncbi:hypothetical protein NIES932_30340 [Raphidiopsis curvata NIES-932]|nr:hypothetical protein NIES932_30340 [Raphidiopsis curvata NIES-932]